ncbi:MAG: hypothetical protein Q9O62_10105 [Ardenticatenia bacterium]|nr:hypothetical protein [Ardenticatenia bacterium]
MSVPMLPGSRTPSQSSRSEGRSGHGSVGLSTTAITPWGVTVSATSAMISSLTAQATSDQASTRAAACSCSTAQDV